MVDQYIRVPPDSTGKRVHTERHNLLFYNAGTIPFDTTQTITGNSSGATGIVLEVVGDTTTGKIFFLKSQDDDVTFIVGEDILVNAVKHAEVQISDVVVNDQVVLLGGANNPHNQVFVDDQGSLNVRYSDGAQQIDAFGLSRFSSPTTLGTYVLAYDSLPEEHSVQIIGAGTETYDANSSSVVLSVGTVTNDEVTRTTNKYHTYQAGFSQYIEMACVCGDVGKTNNIRRWGYFDGYNGLFFELNGTNVNFVRRNFSTGSVVETSIVQSAWSGDDLSGNGGLVNLSKVNLDITKINIYWIDFAWLGTGRVRFGVFSPDGTRIVAHTILNANSLILPYIGKSNLPIRYENLNTGTTTSSSELRVICGSVQIDGRLPEIRNRRSRKTTATSAFGMVVPDGYAIPIGSLRSAKTFNGQENRHLSLPEAFSFYVKTNPVIVKIIKNGALTGENYIQPTDSALEIDGYATSVNGGKEIYTWMIDPGSLNVESPSNFGYYSENITLDASGEYGDIYTLTAQSLGSGPAQITAAITWIDVA